MNRERCDQISPWSSSANFCSGIKFPINVFFSVAARRTAPYASTARSLQLPSSQAGTHPFQDTFKSSTVTRGPSTGRSAPGICHPADVIRRVSNLAPYRTRGFPTFTSDHLESAARGVQNWSYFRERPRGHVLKRNKRLSMGVVTEVPRQQVARRVAQLDVCVRSRPMCHACESGPGLAGYRISDLIEPLFRRVARRNRPISGSATYRNTPREVFG